MRVEVLVREFVTMNDPGAGRPIRLVDVPEEALREVLRCRPVACPKTKTGGCSRPNPHVCRRFQTAVRRELVRRWKLARLVLCDAPVGRWVM